jgi:hypothetical protein
MSADETPAQADDRLKPIDPIVIERLGQAICEAQRALMAEIPSLKHTDLSPRGVVPADAHRSIQKP